jgi:hypothetical protein
MASRNGRKYYIPDSFRHRGRRRAAANCTKKSIDLTDHGRGRRRSPCKVLGLDRTKMFHVKHFGKIGSAGKQRGLVGLRGPCRASNPLTLS